MAKIKKICIFILIAILTVSVILIGYINICLPKVYDTVTYNGNTYVYYKKIDMGNDCHYNFDDISIKKYNKQATAAATVSMNTKTPAKIFLYKNDAENMFIVVKPTYGKRADVYARTDINYSETALKSSCLKKIQAVNINDGSILEISAEKYKYIADCLDMLSSKYSGEYIYSDNADSKTYTIQCIYTNIPFKVDICSVSVNSSGQIGLHNGFTVYDNTPLLPIEKIF